MADTPNPMHDFGFDKGQGLEFGIYTLGDHLPNPNDGSRVSTKERVHEFIRYAQAAEQAGLDYFGLGESHQEFFVSQAHAVILGAIAQATSTMRIGSSSTIISTSDPVRVYENFSTLDLISNGRIELVAGRASRVGLFELLGYDLRDYEELYEEKLELLLQINREESVTWSGQFRAPLNEAEVIPRPVEDRLRIWRAVGGAPDSAIKAGLAGVPMVMAHLGGTTSIFARTVDAYRQAAEHAGFDPATLPITTAGFFHVAETSQKALQNTYRYMNEGMIRTNGQGLSKQMYAQNIDPMSIANMGSPQQVIEKILHQHEVFGHQRYIGQIDFGGVPFDEVMKQIDIIGEEILPAIRKYTAAGAKAQDEEKDN